jgi:putative toxin-antitoxin system antitoxin component (TIGR02293 family)
MRRAKRKFHKLIGSTKDSILKGVLDKATYILGNEDEANRWVNSPALGLNGHRPIDFLHKKTEIDQVLTLLGRMGYCVYT